MQVAPSSGAEQGRPRTRCSPNSSSLASARSTRTGSAPPPSARCLTPTFSAASCRGTCSPARRSRSPQALGASLPLREDPGGLRLPPPPRVQPSGLPALPRRSLHSPETLACVAQRPSPAASAIAPVEPSKGCSGIAHVPREPHNRLRIDAEEGVAIRIPPQSLKLTPHGDPRPLSFAAKCGAPVYHHSLWRFITSTLLMKSDDE